MRKILKNHSKNFSKILSYEKNFKKTIVRIFQKFYHMRKFLKHHSKNFSKILSYEKNFKKP